MLDELKHGYRRKLFAWAKKAAAEGALWALGSRALHAGCGSHSAGEPIPRVHSSSKPDRIAISDANKEAGTIDPCPCMFEPDPPSAAGKPDIDEAA
ncbi:MAG: hypothetical protein R3A46_15020 [Thermomicrobiales bacterium]